MAEEHVVRIEEAALCPKCHVLGELIQSVRTEDERGKPCDIATYECNKDNGGCGWGRWLVQSDERGIVYQRNKTRSGIEHTFPHMSPDQLAHGRRQLEEIQRAEQDPNQELKR